MKQRYIRHDDQLEDDDEVVLRGGELDAAVIRDDARRMFDIYGIYGISVFALRGATIDELAPADAAGPIPVDHRHYRERDSRSGTQHRAHG